MSIRKQRLYGTAGVLLALAGALGAASRAEGDLITFLGTDADGSLVNAFAAFNDFALAAGALNVLDFERTPPGTYSVLVFPGVTLTSSGDFDVFEGKDDAAGAFPVSGTRHIGNNHDANDIIFSFDIPITAFGFFATDLDFEDVIIEFDNGAPQQFTIPNIGVNGSDAFFGFVDTDGLTSEVVVSDTGPLVTYDDVAFVPIPGPAVLPALAIGIALMKRRRRGARGA